LILKSKQVANPATILNQDTKQETPKKIATRNDTETIIKKPPELPGFIFNPIANKEDLI
jgi:hypothetical protein